MIGISYLLIRPDKKVLIQKRTADAPIEPNKYAIPGGAVEAGESSLQACLREIKEETGLSPQSCVEAFEFDYNEGLDHDTLFICSVKNYTVNATEGIMLWMDWNEVESLDLASGMNNLLPQIKGYL